MNFVWLSTMQWESADGAYAPTRLSLELARRGHRVVFVHSYKSETPPDTQGLPVRVVALTELGVPHLAVVLAWRGLYLGARDKVADALAPILDEVGAPGEPWVAVLNAPFDPFVRLLPFLQARGAYVVYYPQDEYAGMAELGYSEYNLAQQDVLVERADLVVSLSETVSAILGARGRAVEVVPDAVDLTEFRAHASDGAAPDVLYGQAATLGYWGTLVDPMVDTQLLVQLAAAKPEWSLNLIGPADLLPGLPPVVEPLSGLDNVRFLGPIAHSQLCRFATTFDVCLLPAPANAMSRGRDPLKVYEYLAVYKPIVATNMPQLTGIPYVRVTHDLAGTVDAVQAALEEPVDKAAVDAFLAKHTWSARAEAFLGLVNTMMTQPPAARGALDAGELEAFGQQQRVGTLAKEEWAALGSIVHDHAEMDRHLKRAVAWAELAQANANESAAEAQRLEKWAHELEAANRAQREELERLYEFLPIKLARKVWKR